MAVTLSLIAAPSDSRGRERPAPAPVAAGPALSTHSLYLPLVHRRAGSAAKPTLSLVLGGAATGVAIHEGLAFVARGAHLDVLDIDSAGAPSLVGRSAPFPGLARDIALGSPSGAPPTASRIAFVTVGAPVFAADGSGAAITQPGLYALDLSRPERPAPLGVLPDSQLDRLAVAGDVAFALDLPLGADSGDPFLSPLRAVDVSNPAAPSRMASIACLGATDVAARPGRAFVCAGDLRIVDLVDGELVERSPVPSGAGGAPIACDVIAVGNAGGDTLDADRIVVASSSEASLTSVTVDAAGTVTDRRRLADLEDLTAVDDLRLSALAIGTLSPSAPDPATGVTEYSVLGGVNADGRFLVAIQVDGPELGSATGPWMAEPDGSIALDIALHDGRIVVASALAYAPKAHAEVLHALHAEGSAGMLGGGLDTLAPRDGLARGSSRSLGLDRLVDTGRHAAPGTSIAHVAASGARAALLELAADELRHGVATHARAWVVDTGGADVPEALGYADVPGWPGADPRADAERIRWGSDLAITDRAIAIGWDKLFLVDTTELAAPRYVSLAEGSSPHLAADGDLLFVGGDALVAWSLAAPAAPIPLDFLDIGSPGDGVGGVAHRNGFVWALGSTGRLLLADARAPHDLEWLPVEASIPARSRLAAGEGFGLALIPDAPASLNAYSSADLARLARLDLSASGGDGVAPETAPAAAFDGRVLWFGDSAWRLAGVDLTDPAMPGVTGPFAAPAAVLARSASRGGLAVDVAWSGDRLVTGYLGGGAAIWSPAGE